MKPLGFLALLEDSADENEIKSGLENLAKNIKAEVICNRTFKLVKGITDSETYERIFNSKVRYEIKKVIDPQGKEVIIEQWVEEKKAQVPENLKGIEKIELDRIISY